MREDVPDGRTVRALRTRTAIADAVLGLLEAGELRSSARRIAEEAGVGLRSIFQHFTDRETLFAAVADRQFDRFRHLVDSAPGEGTIEERARSLARLRAELFELITPVRRAAVLEEPFSEALAARLRWFWGMTRTEVARVFSDELSRLGPDDRRSTLAALQVASSWETWDNLRRREELEVTEAEAVVARTLFAVAARTRPERSVSPKRA